MKFSAEVRHRDEASAAFDALQAVEETIERHDLVAKLDVEISCTVTSEEVVQIVHVGVRRGMTPVDVKFIPEEDVHCFLLAMTVHNDAPVF